MASPRYNQLALDDTPWYHCVSRCVRRAYLCGRDDQSGESYEHRRHWVAQRIKQLAGIFTIDVAAYAVMSNHYHVVVRVDNERVFELSIEEVLQRWTQLYKGSLLVNRYLSDQRAEMSEGELFHIEELATQYRQRLCDLSWFMKNLNEYIARKANKEDQVKGHFWESRYKCQALLDEKAILAAMVYVDLNPVRAMLAETPEESEFTSAFERIQAAKKNQQSSEAKDVITPVKTTITSDLPASPLMPFDATGSEPWSIPFALHDYFELIDWSGRIFHPDKRGAIDDTAPAILKRIGLNPDQFIQCAGDFMHVFGLTVGAPPVMEACCSKRQVKFLRGIKASREMLGAA